MYVGYKSRNEELEIYGYSDERNESKKMLYGMRTKYDIIKDEII
jgi:hypothetical protein